MADAVLFEDLLLSVAQGLESASDANYPLKAASDLSVGEHTADDVEVDVRGKTCGGQTTKVNLLKVREHRLEAVRDVEVDIIQLFVANLAIQQNVGVLVVM